MIARHYTDLLLGCFHYRAEGLPGLYCGSRLSVVTFANDSHFY